MKIVIKNNKEYIDLETIQINEKLVVRKEIQPSNVFAEIESGTVMLFQENTSPIGWTKLTSAKYNGATIQGTTSSISFDGSAHIKDHSHNSAHTHTFGDHTHIYDASHSHGSGPAQLVHTDGTAPWAVLQSVTGHIQSPAVMDNLTTDFANTGPLTSDGTVPSPSYASLANIKYMECIVCQKD